MIWSVRMVPSLRTPFELWVQGISHRGDREAGIRKLLLSKQLPISNLEAECARKPHISTILPASRKSPKEHFTSAFQILNKGIWLTESVPHSESWLQGSLRDGGLSSHRVQRWEGGTQVTQAHPAALSCWLPVWANVNAPVHQWRCLCSVAFC